MPLASLAALTLTIFSMTASAAPMTLGSLSHSTLLRCPTRSSALGVPGSSWCRRCSATMAFLRTFSEPCASSLTVSLSTVAHMSGVRSRTTAVSAAVTSRMLSDARSRCSWLMSMKRNSWSGDRHAPHVR